MRDTHWTLGSSDRSLAWLCTPTTPELDACGRRIASWRSPWIHNKTLSQTEKKEKGRNTKPNRESGETDQICCCLDVQPPWCSGCPPSPKRSQVPTCALLDEVLVIRSLIAWDNGGAIVSESHPLGWRKKRNRGERQRRAARSKSLPASPGPQRCSPDDFRAIVPH